jgi:hypothetical protein
MLNKKIHLEGSGGGVGDEEGEGVGEVVLRPTGL